MTALPSGPRKEEPKKPSSRDIFSRYGGRLPLNLFNQIFLRMPLRGIEREYVRRVMERFTHPYSPGLTREEFKRGLEEMTKNVRDPIPRQLAERIKKHFGL